MLEFEPGLIIWTSLAFGLLVILLYKVALPPLLDFLAAREKLIAESIGQAEAGRRAAEELVNQQKKELQAIRLRADQIIAAAKKEGEEAKQGIVAQADKHADFLVAQAKQEINREKDRVVLEVRQDTAEFEAEAASRVLRRLISPQEHKQIIAESIKEVSHERN